MTFDPYRKWLGIQPKDQPPNHYRLLSLDVFENDVDVIEGAADRAMGFIRQYQSGEHAALAAKLLNEIATARLRLLKPRSKAEYDAKLKKELAVGESAADGGFDFDADLAELKPAQKKSKPKLKESKGQTKQTLWIAGGIAAAVFALVVVVALSLGGKAKNPEPKERVIDDSQSVPPKNAKSVSDEKVSPSKEKVPAEATLPAQNIQLYDSKLVDEAIGPRVDLIQEVDLARDSVAGELKKEGVSLVCGALSRIYLPTKLPDDYQFKVTGKRTTGNDTLALGFVMAGRQGMVAFDANNGQLSGMYLDGGAPDNNCTRRDGSLFKNDQLFAITVTVHPGHLHASVDGQTVIDWHGDSNRNFPFSGHVLPNRESLFIVIANAVYRLESAEMIPIKPESPAIPLPKLDKWQDLMPILDTERDHERGIWSLNRHVLHSPEGPEHARLLLPPQVPEEYSLSMTVELVPGAAGHQIIGVGLPVGNSYCTVSMVNHDCLGLEMIDGNRWNSNEARLGGGFLLVGVPAKIICTVTKQGVRMEKDGRTLIDWKGDLHRLSPQEHWAPVDARKLMLGSHTHCKFSNIKLGPPLDPPRLPSHPPFEIGKPVDLLALVDLKRDALAGTWVKEGSSLKAVGDNQNSKLVIPSEVPPEYKLTLRAARETGGNVANDALFMKLPINSASAEVSLDAAGSTISGLFLDYLGLNDPQNGSCRKLVAIPPGTSRDFTIFVRKTGLKIVSGDETIIDWTGDPRRLSLQAGWGSPASPIVIGSWNTRMRFEKLEIEPLEPSSFPPVPPVGDDSDLRAIIDPVRDSRKGQWKKERDGLVSPEIIGSRLTVPVIPPQRYVLMLDVERKKGNHQLVLGLNVGGHTCNAVIGGGNGNEVGLESLDGKSFPDVTNLTHQVFSEPLFPQGKRIQVQCIVLSDTVIVTCDDNEIIRWHGDPRRFTLERHYQPPNFSEADESKLWLGSWASEFIIRDLRLKSIDDEFASQIEESFSGVFPISPLLGGIPTKSPLTSEKLNTAEPPTSSRKN